MHIKRPDVVTEHSKQSSERTYATALWEKPRKQTEQPVQQCNSHARSPLWLHSTGKGWEQHSCRQLQHLYQNPHAFSCCCSRDLLSLPEPRVQLQHRPGSRGAGAALALDWGLCAAGGASTALKQTPAPAPLQPLCSTISSPRCAPPGSCTGLWLQLCQGKFPLKQRCPCGSLAQWRDELLCAPRGRSCGCCSRARGTKAPACRELPQHPCDGIYQTRGSAGLSRGCLNWPPCQGTPRWPPIPTAQPDTSATTRRGWQPARGCQRAQLLRWSCSGHCYYLLQRLIVYINSQINYLKMILNNGLGLGFFGEFY